MAFSPTPRRALARPRGFTLMELGIVIGVSAILAAAIVPDIIEVMRNRMAEKAASDVVALHDAARLFFVMGPDTTRPQRWPGEQSAGQCNNNFTVANYRFEMINFGFLSSGLGPNAPPTSTAPNFMLNPWGIPYDVSLYAPVSAITTTPACLFGVTTNVPVSIANSFIAHLPQAACDGACPPSLTAVPLGFRRCCSFTSKPSAQLLALCPIGTLLQRNAMTGVLSCN